MLDVKSFREQVLTPILKKFGEDESLANAYSVIWAIDAYATHTALTALGNPGNAYKLEKEFKIRVSNHSWQFRVIHEASNATKHAIRKESGKDVKRSSDIKANTGPSWYAYFNHVTDGVTVDLDWEYRSSENAFFDSEGLKVEGCTRFGHTVYLSRLVTVAISAIEEEGKHSVRRG